jgi:pSer/pThr/pTyr-binding forkhead associated (FHA) protein
VKQIVGERDKAFVPNGRRITIGRDTGRCQVVLNDQPVSGVAAMVESDGASIFVVDLHTTNGTFLNGVRLAAGLRTKLSQRM